jgi:hypothetical protein
MIKSALLHFSIRFIPQNILHLTFRIIAPNKLHNLKNHIGDNDLLLQKIKYFLAKKKSKHTFVVTNFGK